VLNLTIGIRSKVKSLIPTSGTIAKGEIVTGDINCPMTEVRWAKSQSNHDVWVATFLSKKSCTLTNSYSF